jgi:A/G-specific adenine glycosylase
LEDGFDAQNFASLLIEWWSKNKRILPWKVDNDPYKIWISEIILQQTRVDQGTPYFLNFIKQFPDVQALANADEETVMKIWQGLGYYSRARNLHHTAKFICHHYDGQFPSTYEGIRALRGIGPYTASAIASFAFDLPHAVVDGNVIRVIARLKAIDDSVDKSSVKKQIGRFVHDAISQVSSSEFNQAIMDFGSIICTPSKPDCQHCPFISKCLAFSQNTTAIIPYKSPKQPRLTRYFHYFDISDGCHHRVLVQRLEKDIWQHLYQFPMIESTDKNRPPDALIQNMIDHIFEQGDIDLSKAKRVTELKQTLSHRHIVAVFYRIHTEICLTEINKPYCLVDRQKVSNFAFPKIMAAYLAEYMD